MTTADDAALMEASLVAVGDRYDGIGEALFAAFIAAHPQYSASFIYPEAARERMTRETLEALLGLAQGVGWVETAVINFVDLHRNYGAFTPGDYADWVELTIAELERRAGADWPSGAGEAWRRHARSLLELVAGELARGAQAPQ